VEIVVVFVIIGIVCVVESPQEHKRRVMLIVEIVMRVFDSFLFIAYPL